MKNIIPIVFYCLILNACTKTVVQEQDRTVSFPNELTASFITPHKIQLDWADNSYTENGFKIERKTGNGPYELLNTVGENERHYLDSLTAIGAIYTYRVFAFNESHISTYSNEVTVTISHLPVVSTITPQVIPGTAIIKTGANILDDGGSYGGSYISESGICWDINPDPTIALNTKQPGYFNYLGEFNSYITRVFPNTTYYIRSYAINSMGISYGDQVSFTTSDSILEGNCFGGGLVFYTLQPGDTGYDPLVQHGLIVDTTYWAAPPASNWPVLPWTNGTNLDVAGRDSATGAYHWEIGTGALNTNMIVSVLGTGNYAAKNCYDLVQNSYDDWYLPSKDELAMLLNNSYFQTTYPEGSIIGDFWSSTESFHQFGSGGFLHDYYAWQIHSNAGLHIDRYPESWLRSVIAIRSF